MFLYKGSAKESSYCWSVPLAYETSHRNVQTTLTFLKMKTSYVLIPSRANYVVIYGSGLLKILIQALIL